MSSIVSSSIVCFCFCCLLFFQSSIASYIFFLRQSSTLLWYSPSPRNPDAVVLMSDTYCFISSAFPRPPVRKSSKGADFGRTLLTGFFMASTEPCMAFALKSELSPLLAGTICITFPAKPASSSGCLDLYVLYCARVLYGIPLLSR